MWLIILKIVLPLILKDLVKAGVMNTLEADSIKDIGDFISWIKELKTYHQAQDFPSENSRGQQ